MIDDLVRTREFPTLGEMTYFNTAAEGIPPRSALRALEAYFDDKAQGMSGREQLFAEEENCRHSAAGLLGLEKDDIAFCSSTSEGYNLLASALDFSNGGEAVITDLDFPSGATPWLQLDPRPEVRLWKQRDGILDPGELVPLLSEKTRLVQVSLVSFLTGYRLPWVPFRDLVRECAPKAVLAVDVTQAAGRIELDCLDADFVVASSYKWLLGTHGSCLVAVPGASRERITTRAGGWYHLRNAFEEDRFERAEPHPGAKSFAVGMPSFPALYALRAGMDHLNEVGVAAVARQADPIVARIHEGLAEMGIRTMSPPQPEFSTGILSFQSENDEALHQRLTEANIHVMHQAGRIRISVHGYNRMEEAEKLLRALRTR